MILNDEIDIEKARAFSMLARTVAQAVGLEVQRARFLKQIPDLTISDEEKI